MFKCNLVEIVEEFYRINKETIYKEDIDLVNAILTLRKECPQSYKSTAIANILMGKSKNYTKHQYFGFALANPKWLKNKSEHVWCHEGYDKYSSGYPGKFCFNLVRSICEPLEEYVGEPEIEDENVDTDFLEHIGIGYKVDKIKIMLLNRTIKRLYEKYTENSPKVEPVQMKLKIIGKEKFLNNSQYVEKVVEKLIEYIKQRKPTAVVDERVKITEDGFEMKIDGTPIPVVFGSETCTPSERKYVFYPHIFNFYTNKNGINCMGMYKMQISFDKDMNYLSSKFELDSKNKTYKDYGKFMFGYWRCKSPNEPIFYFFNKKYYTIFLNKEIENEDSEKAYEEFQKKVFSC